MTTITNNKLTDERVSNATLIRLIQWAEQHNSHYVAAALCELQERRKADSAEPAGYHVIKECGKVGCSVTTLEEAEKTRDFWNKRWTIRPYFYTQPASEREQIRRKTEPVAYLVCNGCLYQDRPFLDLSTARKSVKDRNDGAEIKALCVCEISAEK